MPFAFANVATNSTDEPVTNPVTGNDLAAVAGQKVRVYALDMVTDETASDVTLYSVPDTGTSTAISPLFALGANGGMVLPHNPRGWFDTLPGETLGVTTPDSGGTIGVHIVYDYLPGDSH